jgi:xanthine/CO dehydrogenase XdhC/CoxF family maturation factor
VREVLSELIEWSHAGDQVGVATVVATYQSAPRVPVQLCWWAREDKAVGSASGVASSPRSARSPATWIMAGLSPLPPSSSIRMRLVSADVVSDDTLGQLTLGQNATLTYGPEASEGARA